MTIRGAGTVRTVGRLALPRGVGKSLPDIGEKQGAGKDADNKNTKYKRPVNLTHLS